MRAAIKEQEISLPGRLNGCAKALSFIVTAGGLTVIAGWIFDIGVFKTISPAFVSMKFSTAFSFVASGISLYFLVRTHEEELEKAQVALSITSFTLSLLMGLLLFSVIFGIDTGIENLFMREIGAVKSVVPGRPSLPTMVNFLLIAFAGILALLNPERPAPRLKIVGIAVCAIGAVAVAGYILNAPLLYYYVPAVNSAMAIHTALLFVLCGMGLACL
jgi:cytochrome bd-type quinol oxidase subunit 2